MRKLILILPIVLWSCGNQKNSEENATSDSASTITTNPTGETFSSMDFMDKTITDNFFVKKKIGKVFTINNLIGLRYIVKDNEATVTCLSYNPTNASLIIGRGMSYNSDYSIGGQKLTVVDNETIHPGLQDYEFEFKLTDPEQVKLLSFYMGGRAVNQTQYDFKDLFTVSATLDEYAGGVLYFSGASLTKQMISTPMAKVEEQPITEVQPSDAAVVNTNTGQAEADERVSGTIVSDKAFFYQEKDKTTQRKAYLVKGDKVKYFSGGTDEFTMAFYTDGQGKTTSGWMLKSDIK